MVDKEIFIKVMARAPLSAAAALCALSYAGQDAEQGKASSLLPLCIGHRTFPVSVRTGRKRGGNILVTYLKKQKIIVQIRNTT